MRKFGVFGILFAMLNAFTFYVDGDGSGGGGAGDKGGGKDGDGKLFPDGAGKGTNPTLDLSGFAAKERSEAQLNLAKELGYESVEAMKADRAGKKPAKQKDQPEDDAEAARRRIAQLEGEITQGKVNDAVMQALYGHEVVDMEVAKGLLKNRLDIKDGIVIVLDEHGHPRYNTKGEKMTPKEYVEILKAEKAYLFKPAVKAGPGITPGGRYQPGDEGAAAREVLKGKVLTLDQINDVFPGKKK